MNTFQLDFGNITILEPHFAEVIINDGIVMNKTMVDAYHDFLLSHLEAPIFLLINKKHSYTYDFEAQKSIANLSAIKAIAVVIHSHITAMATEIVININRENDWNIELFDSREAALHWLKNQ